MAAPRKEDNAIFRIPPYYYIHVLDQNTNVTKIEIGPQTYIRQDNQRVTLGPEKMVVVPPRHYCVIENPVCRDKDNKIIVDNLGQIKLQHADQEIRLTQDPFPLYPGEVLKQPVTALKVVPANSALRIRAILDFEDEIGEKRTAGDEWLFEGPGTSGYENYKLESEFNALIRPLFGWASEFNKGKMPLMRPLQRKSWHKKFQSELKNLMGKLQRNLVCFPTCCQKHLLDLNRLLKDLLIIGPIITGTLCFSVVLLVYSSDLELIIQFYVLVASVFLLFLLTSELLMLIHRSFQSFLLKRYKRRWQKMRWLPGTYIPRKECVVEETIRATVIGPNQAIRLRARKECMDRDSIDRVTGEEWLVKKTGAYLPGAYEEVVDLVNAYVLTEKKALHMRALRTFKDDFGVTRKNGEEWLITMKDTETHIPNVYEEVVGVVNITTLNNRQYCVILDPVDTHGKPQLGQKKLVKGERSFFLMPGEKLEKGIQNVYILGEDEGLILRANETFVDGDTTRSPGDRWMIRGPKEYVPPVEVEVAMKRQAIPLDENEGIYVRDIKNGKVRAIQGETYMLNQDEELWPKELPPTVESLLSVDHLAERSERKTPEGTPKVRDKTRVVSFRVPHNAAVQIYDYKEKKARVIFGPELVMLGPDEQFTQLSLSGGKPKKPNVIKSLCLLLGPDFCTDIIVVETADHARLSLQLSYNWHFECVDRTPVEAAKLFSVPDFTGDSCKAIASRVRGAVAQVQFDDFHKNSAKIIRASVFGMDANGKVKDKFHFPQNNMVITSIDIQSVEPVDQRTRDALQKSVQLAIEITTNSQEAAARHEAERLEQEAKGRLERQKITDEAEAEKARKELLELQANSAAVESTGQAKAEAQSRAEAARIEGEAAVEQARLKSQATKIEAESELERLTKARDAELKYVCEQNKMELEKASEVSTIEITKFKEMVGAIGANTLLAMATAGPDMQVRMLQALGLKSTLITDGSSPINLFNTASGLIGGLVPSKRRHPQDDDDSAD